MILSLGRLSLPCWVGGPIPRLVRIFQLVTRGWGTFTVLMAVPEPPRLSSGRARRPAGLKSGRGSHPAGSPHRGAYAFVILFR